MKFVHTELKRDTWIKPAQKVLNADDAVNVVRSMMKDVDREMVVCIHMARNGRVISTEISAIGTIDQACVSPAEILRTALLTGARSIILMHQHPSGECRPSEEDIKMTQRLAMAADLMGIQLLDHIIVGDDDTYSMSRNQPDVLKCMKIQDFEDIAAEVRR